MDLTNNTPVSQKNITRREFIKNTSMVTAAAIVSQLISRAFAQATESSRERLAQESFKNLQLFVSEEQLESDWYLLLGALVKEGNVMASEKGVLLSALNLAQVIALVRKKVQGKSLLVRVGFFKNEDEVGSLIQFVTNDVFGQVVTESDKELKDRISLVSTLPNRHIYTGDLRLKKIAITTIKDWSALYVPNRFIRLFIQNALLLKTQQDKKTIQSIVLEQIKSPPRSWITEGLRVRVNNETLSVIKSLITEIELLHETNVSDKDTLTTEILEIREDDPKIIKAAKWVLSAYIGGEFFNAGALELSEYTSEIGWLSASFGRLVLDARADLRRSLEAGSPSLYKRGQVQQTNNQPEITGFSDSGVEPTLPVEKPTPQSQVRPAQPQTQRTNPPTSPLRPVPPTIDPAPRFPVIDYRAVRLKYAVTNRFALRDFLLKSAEDQANTSKGVVRFKRYGNILGYHQPSEYTAEIEKMPAINPEKYSSIVKMWAPEIQNVLKLSEDSANRNGMERVEWVIRRLIRLNLIQMSIIDDVVLEAKNKLQVFNPIENEFGSAWTTWSQDKEDSLYKLFRRLMDVEIWHRIGTNEAIRANKNTTALMTTLNSYLNSSNLRRDERDKVFSIFMTIWYRAVCVGDLENILEAVRYGSPRRVAEAKNFNPGKIANPGMTLLGSVFKDQGYFRYFKFHHFGIDLRAARYPDGTKKPVRIFNVAPGYLSFGWQSRFRGERAILANKSGANSTFGYSVKSQSVMFIADEQLKGLRLELSGGEKVVEFIYAHLVPGSTPRSLYGQRVNRDTFIGMMGTSGLSEGIHLHFEIRVNGFAVDPRAFWSIMSVGNKRFRVSAGF